MASKKTKAAKSAASGAASAANTAKANPYLQRLVSDEELRDNLQKAVASGKSAYGRLSNGKAPHRAIVEDKKLQKDLRETFEAVRSAGAALSEGGPKKSAKRGLRLGRKLFVVGLVGGGALAASEPLRSKVLDALFGKEEEFEYSPPAGTTPSSTPTQPVSAA